MLTAAVMIKLIKFKTSSVLRSPLAGPFLRKASNIGTTLSTFVGYGLARFSIQDIHGEECDRFLLVALCCIIRQSFPIKTFLLSTSCKSAI